MDEGSTFAFGISGSDPYQEMAGWRLKRQRRGMKKYLFASLLCLGLGASFPGQSLAADTTPPVITAAVKGTLGSNGWYRSNVNVSWSVTDGQSAITSKTGCAPVSRTTDTAGVTYTCKATSGGGTSSKSVTIKRDTTKPIAKLTSPVAGAFYTLNQAVGASYTCGDGLSRMASCKGTVANVAAINTATAGKKSFNVTARDIAGNQTVTTVNYTVTASAAIKGTQLFAWNDLGMHCADSDFSIFTLLPPFNDLNAQLVVNGKLITNLNSANYVLTYQATADPKGSINSTSIGKTNFWTYDVPLFGANLPPNVGLTGYPMASSRPARLDWSSAFNWYEASGIPITPIDDSMRPNYFPLVKVTALDRSGRAIASTRAVLPVSSEINCNACHASNSSSAAEPAGGWVNLTPGSERDWRLNILRLHDEMNSGDPNYAALLARKGYGTSLEISAADNGKPILCDTCHNSNALAVWGIKGETGVSNMTAAMHNRHANVSLPGSNQTLNSITTRDSCYNCHPGRNTQCLRGAMGNPVNVAGKHTMECQSCHGNMVTVGKEARNGWYDMPTCQACHHDGRRETVAIKPDGTFKKWADTRFASNPNTPEAGWSLYRFSTGHGKLQCEACHNSTHAEFTNKPGPNNNQVNDNLRAVQAQGYAAAIRECTVCHPTMPSTIKGGPHGMHNLGQSWVDKHHDAFDSVAVSTCYYCHGSTSSGSPLALIKIAKTFKIDDGRSKTFAANTRVTCWSCHDGPNP